MATNTAVRRDTLQFDPNISYELVLKYSTGRQIANGRVMFSTTDDRVFFLDQDDAYKIHALGLAPNEPFTLVKRVTGAGKNSHTEIQVSKVGEQRTGRSLGEGVPPAAGTTEPKGSSAPSPDQHSSLARVMASAYISAIDALQIAEEYARSKGVTFRVTEEVIHTSANSIFIEVGKSKERDIREREFNARYGYTQAPEQKVNGGATWQRH